MLFPKHTLFCKYATSQCLRKAERLAVRRGQNHNSFSYEKSTHAVSVCECMLLLNCNLTHICSWNYLSCWLNSTSLIPRGSVVAEWGPRQEQTSRAPVHIFTLHTNLNENLCKHWLLAMLDKQWIGLSGRVLLAQWHLCCPSNIPPCSA